MDVHIVQRGDTLWKISRQYGISFEDLKRVNAHLANPDYIVPGMKIFLPEKKQKVEVPKQPSIDKGQTKEQQVEKMKPVEKKEPEIVKKPVQPKEEIPVPKEPIPLPSAPKAPTITSKPLEQPRPPKAEKPKEKAKEKPVTPLQPEPERQWQAPVPPAAPGRHQQPPQMAPLQPYPIIGIPCGWFPIYDADCYPHLHPRQMQPMHPMPPMTQLPVEDHHNFRPSRPESRPIQREQQSVPNLPKQEEKKVKPAPLQPKLQEPILTVPKRMPDIEEPARQKTPKVPKEQAIAPPTYDAPYSQQFHEPMPQQNWPYNMQQPYPVHAGQQLSPCGCNQFEPVQMMPQQMPMHPHPHPFCQSCNQPMFYPMRNHWPGTYS